MLRQVALRHAGIIIEKGFCFRNAAWCIFCKSCHGNRCENCLLVPSIEFSKFYTHRNVFVGTATYLVTHIIGNAEAFPILCVRYIRWEREREIQREKDGSDVTIVALKLAMSFALLLAKNVHLRLRLHVYG